MNAQDVHELSNKIDDEDSSDNDEGITTFFMTGNNKFKSLAITPSKVPDTLRDIDDAADEYLEEIMNHWFSQEKVERQVIFITSQITSQQVMILSDWLSSVAGKFKLVKESWCLSQYMLKYCLCDPDFSDLTKDKLQLLGTTCLFIASKVEEIYPPNLRDFIKIADRTYSKKEFLDMEQRVLKTLQFRVTFVTPLQFLRVFSRVLQNGAVPHTLANYLMQVAMTNISLMFDYLPSEIAAGAEYLAKYSLNEPIDWNESIIVVSLDKAKQVARDIYNTVAILKNLELNALSKLYGQEKNLSVSKIPLKNV
jgi:hypothetical protein